MKTGRDIFLFVFAAAMLTPVLLRADPIVVTTAVERSMGHDQLNWSVVIFGAQLILPEILVWLLVLRVPEGSRYPTAFALFALHCVTWPIANGLNLLLPSELLTEVLIVPVEAYGAAVVLRWFGIPCEAGRRRILLASVLGNAFSYGLFWGCQVFHCFHVLILTGLLLVIFLAGGCLMAVSHLCRFLWNVVKHFRAGSHDRGVRDRLSSAWRESSTF